MVKRRLEERVGVNDTLDRRPEIGVLLNGVEKEIVLGTLLLDKARSL
jgi:hypothetical protein